MNWLKYLLRRWLYGEDVALVLAAYEMLIKCARRCAYDLGHAVDMVDQRWLRSDPGFVAHMRETSRHWIRLFASGNAMKDYTAQIQLDLAGARDEIDRLRDVITAAGIEGAYPNDDIPF